MRRGRDIFESKEYWKGDKLLLGGIWQFAFVMKHYLGGEIKAGEMEGPCCSSEMSEKRVQNLVGIPEKSDMVVGVRRNILTLIVEGTV
jgi:hypothetical protein